jgi:hypothetical protein
MCGRQTSPCQRRRPPVKKLGSRDRVGRWHVGRVCLRTGMAAASGRGPWNRFPLLRLLSHAPLLFGVGDVFCPLPSAPPPPGVPSRLTDPTTSQVIQTSALWDKIVCSVFLRIVSLESAFAILIGHKNRPNEKLETTSVFSAR